MRGYIDKLNANLIAGWACDLDAPNKPALVDIILDEKTIASKLANTPRPDVARALGLDGDFGFLISKADFGDLTADQLKRVKVVVKGAAETARQELSPPPARRKNPQYQSFDDAPGASRSTEKLLALRLQEIGNRANHETPLKGLKVLDLGCNEGFFCGEALKQGASRVVGIDANAGFLEGARKRFPKAEFIHGSWWDIPDEKFDVIFFLSAIHYEKKQKALLQKISSHLSENGTFILECGVAHTRDKNWLAIRRGDGLMRYPNLTTLSEDLLTPFAWRHAGQSVKQEGDPVARSVFHCRHKQNTALLIVGNSNSGKSTLAFNLKHHGCAIVQTDTLIAEIFAQPRYNWSPVAEVVRNFKKAPVMHFGEMGKAIVEAGLSNEFCEILMLEAPLDSELFAIEGEILRHPQIYRNLKKRLDNNNIKVWEVKNPATS